MWRSAWWVWNRKKGKEGNMYRVYAIKFHRKKVDFIDGVNLTERIKKARALPSGVSHMGLRRYVMFSTAMGKGGFVTVKGCQ